LNWKGLMKHPFILLLCLSILTACLSEEEKRLQTDQSFEGEEMFSLSYSLDEHVAYAFRSLEFYRDTVNQSVLPGCPVVTINDVSNEVVLTFGGAECPTNKPLRTGKLILSYTSDTLANENQQVAIRYEDYWVKGVKVDGRRQLHSVDSAAADLALLDSISDFVITDANRSTSKLNGVLLHELFMEADSLRYYTTTGSGAGRNLTGRAFTFDINQEKHFSSSCVQGGDLVAESGKESWTFERTAARNVIHTVNYQQAEDCSHTAQIQLDDGRELFKKQ
jgi:uncharacterized protein YcfL